MTGRNSMHKSSNSEDHQKSLKIENDPIFLVKRSRTRALHDIYQINFNESSIDCMIGRYDSYFSG